MSVKKKYTAEENAKVALEALKGNLMVTPRNEINCMPYLDVS